MLYSQTMSQRRTRASFATSLLQKKNQTLSSLLASTCSRAWLPLLRPALAQPPRRFARTHTAAWCVATSPAASRITTARREGGKSCSYLQLENSFGAIFMAYFQFSVTADSTSSSEKCEVTAPRRGERRDWSSPSAASSASVYGCCRGKTAGTRKGKNKKIILPK